MQSQYHQNVFIKQFYQDDEEYDSPSTQVRVRGNKNLHQYTEPFFRELPVQTQRGPVVTEWLDKLYDILWSQMANHSRLFILRFDLRFPANFPIPVNGILNNSFFSLFKKRIRSFLDSLNIPRHHGLKICAAREYDKGETRPHYHVLLILNGNAIRATGQWDLSSENMYSRIHAAWAYALQVCIEDTVGLIQFCDPKQPFIPYQVRTSGGSILLERNDYENFAAVFYAASYLAKIATKRFNDGCQPFLCSRL